MSRLSTVLSRLVSILLALFGSFKWSPPSWLRSCGCFAIRSTRAGWTWLNAKRVARPRWFWGTVVTALLVIVGGVCGWRWYQRLPKPELLSVKVWAPAALKLEKDAQPSKLVIDFSGSAAPLAAVGKVITSGLEVTPAPEGEWRWQSDRQIIFTPAQDWPVGQTYRIRFARQMLASHIRLEDYSVTFDSAHFSAFIQGSEFFEDPIDPKLKKVITTVKFSHPIDKADFEKHLSYKLRVNPLKSFDSTEVRQFGFKVVYDEFSGTAFVHSDPLPIPDDDGEMLLTVEKGIRSSRGGDASAAPMSKSTAIPGMLNYFKVAATHFSYVQNQQYETEQVATVVTSVPVAQAELSANVEAYVLPKDRPAFQGFEFIKNYHWSGVSEIGPEVLSQATKVAPTWIPTAHDFEKVQSFKFTAPPNSFLYLQVKKGLRSFGDYKLPKEYATVMRIGLPPREVRVMGDGALLSLTGDKTVSVLTRDVEAVQFEISRVLPGTISHLITQTEGDFKSPSFQSYNFSFDDITARETKVQTLPKLGPGKAQYSAFDFTPYLAAAGAQRGLFSFRVDGYDPENKRTTGVSDQRLILVTDLGILVKDSLDGTHDLFVQSLRSGAPEADAEVQLLGRNGLVVLTQKTGPDGHVTFPKLSDFKREREAVVYVVQKGNDTAFLPLNRADRKLNLSRFDIGGASSSENSLALEAVLFSDRGIYRPADEIHIAMIVKNPKWRALEDGVPLEVSVTDPRGIEVASKKIRFSQAGFEEYSYRTQDTSLTGSYHFTLYILKDGQRHAELGTTVVRVEEFLPDRMNIQAHFSAPLSKGWISPKDLKGLMTLRNLFGTAAEKHKASGALYLSPSYPAFAGFRDYHFFDPLATKKSFNEQLGETLTNDKGEAEFDLHLERFEKATYRATFFAEGFELEGGRSVTTSVSSVVSPMPFVVGYKPDGDLGYIHKDAKRTVEFLALGPTLDKVAAADLKLDLFEIRYVSVLAQQPNGTYVYESVKKEILKDRRDFAIPGSGMEYQLPTTIAGNFALIVHDKDDIELNRVTFSVVGAGNLTSNLERNAELDIKLNKTDFAPGEEIEVSVVAPYHGAGLISIEKERTYGFKWFSSGTTSFVEKIKLPDDIEGNGYLNVTFVRALDSKEVFMSPLSYAVVPFTVSKARRMHKITLNAPEKARPGETFNISYKSETPGRIAIFAADEGILQVARYSTPDPLSYFLRKRSLEVETAQILDLLMPEMSVLRSLSAAGGDEEALLAKNLNPFKRKSQKPVAFWSGIQEIDATERSFSFIIPDYFNGTVRVMAVSVTPDAIGSFEKRSTVKGPFVINPNVPTFVAPGDTFEVTTSVARSDEGADPDSEVACTLSTGPGLEVLSSAQQKLPLAPGKEGSCAFKVKAKTNLGSCALTFGAATSTQKSKLTLDLSVRPSVPFMAQVQTGFFKKGLFSSGKVEVPVTRKLYPEHRTLEASASVFPFGIANGLVSYLRAFAHGCSEQIVSQVFPDVILTQNKNFDFTSENFAERYERVLSILRSRQNSEGAFGFWTANSTVSDFQTIYAVHFMLEAKERGLNVPGSMLTHAMGYLKTLLASDDHSQASFRRKAYSVYLLTRGGMVTTNNVNTLREALEKYFPDTWKSDISVAFLASTYKMLKLDREAEQLIKTVPIQKAESCDYENYYDQLLRSAQYIYLLSRHFPERAKELSGDDLMDALQEIPKGHFNTLSSAYTVLAIDAYSKAVGTPANAGAAIVEIDTDAEKNLGVGPGAVARANFSDAAQTVRFSGQASLPLFYQLTETGFDTNLPNEEIKQGIEVLREFRNAKGEVVTAAKLGEELQVHIILRSVDTASHWNIAVVDLLPGGSEVKMPLSMGINTLTPLFSLDYVDARDDRVVFYGDVTPQAHHYYYTIKCTQRGSFEQPPLFAESMYDRTVRARTLGGRLVVE